MLLLLSIIQSLWAYGLNPISSVAEYCSDIMSLLRSSLGLALGGLKHACLSAIANNYFVKKIIIEGSWFILKTYRSILQKLFLSLILVLPMSVQAITITNTATVNSDIGIYNSSVDMVTVLPPTPSSIVAYQYAPTATGTSSITVPLGEYSPSGSLTGPFIPTPQPTTLAGVPIPVPAALDLLPVNTIKGGEPLFIEVTDPNSNTSSLVVETVVIEFVTASGDRAIIRLTETGANTGIFTGYIQTSLAPSAVDDDVLTVSSDEIVSATYIDSSYNSDSSSVNVLVDPNGIIFDSTSGLPVDGVDVTLIDTGTGLPATVFGDDGISIFPSTITTGGSATDSSGAVYNFPPGYYRFPLIAPGNYRLDIVTPLGFNAPSTVPTADLQILPGAPYAIITGSRGEDFVVNPGPPVRLDVPVDVDNGGLFLVKRAVKDQVGLGEFLQYSIQVSNTSLSDLDLVQLTDTLPEGFRYQEGSATWGGAPLADPVVSQDARNLLFDLGTISSTTKSELKYIVSVSAGAIPGYAINQVIGTALGGITSNTAEATVMVKDDFMRSESIVMGRVLLEVCEAAGPPKGEAALTLHTETNKGQVLHTLNLEVNSVPVKDMVLEVRLPGALEYQSGSATIEGKSIPDPDIFGGQLKFKLGDV